MKIAVISHTYPTSHATAQATFIKHETHLISQEHEVELYLPSVLAVPFQRQFYRTHQPNEKKIRFHQFSYLSFPGRRFASITRSSLSKRLLSSLKKQQPDLVHLHWLYPAGLTVPVLKKAGYTVVLTLHGGDWYSNVSSHKRMALLKTSLQMCDKIICVGKQLIEDIGNYHSALKDKLVHIPHGIDTDCFFPSGDVNPIKNKPTWNRTKTNILCVANLYHGKGIDLLIKAFAALSGREKCHLHIISPGGDQSTKTEIQTLINTYSLDHQVSFYGAQNRQQLAGFYRAADLLVSPSRKEGFGLVVAEAIACGTPVLATRSGGPTEIVTNENGLLVETNSVDALKDGMEVLLTSLEQFDPKNLHHYIRENFSIETKREKLMTLYKTVTNP